MYHFMLFCAFVVVRKGGRWYIRPKGGMVGRAFSQVGQLQYSGNNKRDCGGNLGVRQALAVVIGGRSRLRHVP